MGDTLYYLIKQGHSLLQEKLKEDIEYKKKRLAKVSGDKINDLPPLEEWKEEQDKIRGFKS